MPKPSGNKKKSDRKNFRRKYEEVISGTGRDRNPDKQPKTPEQAVTIHAMLRYCERVYGWKPAEYGGREHAENFETLTKMLEDKCPGMTVDDLKKKMLTPAVRTGWRMGCPRVKDGGLVYTIASRRIVTVI